MAVVVCKDGEYPDQYKASGEYIDKAGRSMLERYNTQQNPIQSTLAQRGSRYGDFTDNARLSQEMKTWLASQPGWTKLSLVQRETLEMIAQKIARILNGDPDYPDNWHDIAGYATLVEQRCQQPAEDEGEKK